MSWYNPGDWDWGRIGTDVATGGFAEPARYAYENIYKKPADAKKAGLDKLSQGLTGLADQQRDFQLAGLDKGLAAYGKSNGIYDALYGSGPSALGKAAYVPPGTK